MSVDVEQHHKAAAELLPDPRLLVGGTWVRGGGATLEQVNPTTAEVQAEFRVAGIADVDATVAAAADAAPAWRDTPPFRRRELLCALAARVRQATDEFATLLALETGLPVGLTRSFAERGADFFDYYGGLAQAMEGELIPANPATTLNYVVPEPYGVVALVMTWNGGMSALGRKAGAALAAGNTAVIKPSELTPFTAVRFGELALEVGFPEGVVNILLGDSVAGDHLVRSTAVRKVSFTGGLGAARRIQEAAAAAPKPVALELGGKSANIVFADADLERAAQTAASGALLMSGQGCALPTRLLIQSSVFDEVLDRVLDLAAAMAIGDPLDPTTTMGPIVSQSHRDRILSVIDQAIETKAGDLRVGGGPVDELAPGFFVEPTVFVDVDPSSSIAQEEIFGPVLSVFRFDDDSDAVALANGTEYGLGAFVHTSSLNRALAMVRRLHAGSVTVNSFPASARGTVATPFGGIKNSGFGREGGHAGLAEFLTTKHVSMGWA